MTFSKSNSLLISLMALDFLSYEKSINILYDMKLYETGWISQWNFIKIQTIRWRRAGNVFLMVLAIKVIKEKPYYRNTLRFLWSKTIFNIGIIKRLIRDASHEIGQSF